MASKLVVDAVNARLAASWTHCPVIGTNLQAARPSDGSAFLECQYLLAKETHIGLGQVGQRSFREEGVIRFVLSVPRGTGIDLAGTWLDDLRNLFRAAQFGGVNCLGAAPAADDGSNGNGNYYIMRMLTDYYADILA
jgi:hypothetical protein